MDVSQKENNSLHSRLQKVFNTSKDFLYNKLPAIIKENIEVSSTKRSKIIAAVITAILLLTAIIDNSEFTSLTFRSKWLILAFCMSFPFLIGIFIAFKFKLTNPKVDKVWHFLLLFLMPFLTISMTECLNSIFIYNMTYLGFLGNYLLILFFYFFAFAIAGSFRVAIISVNTVLYGLALAHCFIMEFRGTPFIPMDFLSITTAANVANTYSYKLTYTVLTGTLLYLFILVIGIRIKTPKYHIVTRIVSRTFMGSFFAIVMLLFYCTPVFADAGVKPDFWNQARGYRNYGFVFNFFSNTKYLYMSTPSGYDPDDVGNYVASAVDKEENTITPSKDAPNIICIMNESLADLSVLGNVQTNEDYMPFIHSLSDNTVKGNLFVPVIGAGTSNTEFEFLTGHTTAFLPSGSNAYMLYIKNPLASLVSTLEGQGYSSSAFHPYYSSGWNRVNVYNYMGFNNTKFLENIMDISIMDEYMQNASEPDYLQQLINQYYPERKNMILRQYVSDAYDFDVLVKDYESRDKSVPFFEFNVTMQNHGGYTTEFGNFNESIYLTAANGEYPKANRYLSLIRESDRAFEQLINYFKNVKEPTVICMFGDHQPSVETSFVAEAFGVNDISGLTLQQEQARHVTPFIIWANYDIPEENINMLSSNYLSSYVLKTAGVKLTDYNKYLLKLSDKLPVIDTVGYIDAEGNYYNWNDKTAYSEILNEYERIQYNNIFDSKNKDTDIFYLKGYKGDEGKDVDGTTK